MTDTQTDKSSVNQNNYTYTKNVLECSRVPTRVSDHMLSACVECSANVPTVECAFLNKMC